MANENGLYVNVPGMIKNGNETIDSAEDLASSIQSLRSNAEGLLALWTGEKGGAAEAFYDVYTAYQKQLDDIQQQLVQRGEGVIDAAKNWQKTEEDIAATVRRNVS